MGHGMNVSVGTGAKMVAGMVVGAGAAGIAAATLPAPASIHRRDPNSSCSLAMPGCATTDSPQQLDRNELLGYTAIPSIGVGGGNLLASGIYQDMGEFRLARSSAIIGAGVLAYGVTAQILNSATKT